MEYATAEIFGSTTEIDNLPHGDLTNDLQRTISLSDLAYSRRRRVWLAATRMTRALEFRTWLSECDRQRSRMHLLMNSAVFVTILCLAYTNLVFAVKFDRGTCADWLTTCVIAVVVESVLQQPVILLMTGVLGDFVEEGADFLLEVLDF